MISSILSHSSSLSVSISSLVSPISSATTGSRRMTSVSFHRIITGRWSLTFTILASFRSTFFSLSESASQRVSASIDSTTVQCAQPSASTAVMIATGAGSDRISSNVLHSCPRLLGFAPMNGLAWTTPKAGQKMALLRYIRSRTPRPSMLIAATSRLSSSASRQDTKRLWQTPTESRGSTIRTALKRL